MTTGAGTQDGRMVRAEEPAEPLGDFEVDDPYMAWVREQGVPLIVEYAFEDLNALELSPWEPKGGSGAIINIPNRVLPNDAHVVEIAPGGKSEPVHHMYETQMYVLSGRGATSIWVDESRKQTFEWKAGSVFAIPLNAWYQLFNGSGAEPARYIAVTSAPPIMRLYRDNHFIFNLPYVFANRYADDSFNGTGRLYNGRIWESNFIPNADNMPLYGMPLRGAGGINAQLEMAKNSITAHISEFPVGTYKKAHHHGPGAHLIILSGDAGFSLLWNEDDRSDMRKVDWKKGSMVVVPERADVPPALQRRHEAGALPRVTPGRAWHGPALRRLTPRRRRQHEVRRSADRVRGRGPRDPRDSSRPNSPGPARPAT